MESSGKWRWNEHVAKWKPVETHYGSAAELNEQQPLLKTVGELESDPYPFADDVLTVCFIDHDDDYQWKNGPDNLLNDMDFAYPCDILERSNNGQLYTVLVDFDNENDVRSAIRFFDQLYRSDDYMRNSFRRSSDSAHADAWRDLRGGRN